MDPFDFKNEFRQMANNKLNDSTSTNPNKVEKTDLLDTVHRALESQSNAYLGQMNHTMDMSVINQSGH